jgi:Mg2+ transporter MgtE
VETVAETLEEVEPEFQAALVETMPDERVADVLEEMSPDAAADLLAELPEGRSEDLLNLMEKEDAADVRKLLSYPIDTAGGLMTTEYVEVRPDLTAEQAIALLREEAPEAETIYYVYVTNENGQLVGVFSLSDLVLAKPHTPITDFMHHRVVTVNVNDSQDDVAHVVSKYNLLAVPVVDDQHRLQGIVTSDDALDKIIPTAWKKIQRPADRRAPPRKPHGKQRPSEPIMASSSHCPRARLILASCIEHHHNVDNDGASPHSVATIQLCLLWIMPLLALALIVVQR